MITSSHVKRLAAGGNRKRLRWAAAAAATAAVAVATALLLAQAAPAAVPGSNGLIAFRAVTDSGSQVFTINPVTLQQVQLTHVDGDAQANPHWSPDSSKITFEYDPANVTSNDYCHVATMNADGGNLTFLPLANKDQCEAAPAFSADGTRILYEGYDGKHRDQIWSMKLDGSDRRLVTACEGRGVTDPEPSPDGKMLAFTCYSRNGSALFDSRIDGSGLRQLTSYDLNVGIHEDWSPDSRHIMFLSTHDEDTSTAQVNTATIDPDGKNLRWLTTNPAGGSRSYGNSYSPDGQWIVLRQETGDQSGDFQSALFKMKTDGSNLTQITPYSSFRPRGMCWGSAAG